MGEPLDDYKLFSDAQEIKKLYEKAGYQQTKVEAKQSINEQLGRATVTFDIKEAPKVRIMEVQFVGAQAFSQRKLRKQLKTRRHWMFSWLTGSGKLKEEQFQEDQEKLKDFYWSEGYIDFEIKEVKLDYSSPTRLVIRFIIDEGEPSRIEKIEIRGNTKTKDKVIRRELSVSPGEVFDMVRVKLSKERLEGLQYFTPPQGKVQMSVEPTEVPNLKNLIVDVEEGSSGNFYFGAGFSSIDQLFGYVGMTQGNFDLFNPPYFTGGGQKLRLQATIGTRQENYELSFVEPWFLNRHLALDFDLFHRDILYYSDLYDQRETGARIGLRRALFTDAFQVALNYTIENVGIHFDQSLTATNIVMTPSPFSLGQLVPINTVVPPSISPTLAEESGDRLVSKVGVTLTYDTRGGGYLPRRGQLTSLSASVAGGPFGGDTDFYKLDLQSS